MNVTTPVSLIVNGRSWCLFLADRVLLACFWVLDSDVLYVQKTKLMENIYLLGLVSPADSVPIFCHGERGCGCLGPQF